jgi:GNAT superfamily N-acetyltransferase
MRRLRKSDSDKVSAHWSRLERHDRHERFNGAVAGDFLEYYSAHLFSPGSIIAGYFENGEIRGVGELRPTGRGQSFDAELAFSVEAAWKRRGIGTRLMRMLMRDGGATGYARIGFETNSENVAMKALGRKFNARMRHGGGESCGVITIPEQQIQIVCAAHPWTEGLWEAAEQICAGISQIILSVLRPTRS